MMCRVQVAPPYWKMQKVVYVDMLLIMLYCIVFISIHFISCVVAFVADDAEVLCCY